MIAPVNNRQSQPLTRVTQETDFFWCPSSGSREVYYHMRLVFGARASKGERIHKVVFDDAELTECRCIRVWAVRDEEASIKSVIKKHQSQAISSEQASHELYELGCNAYQVREYLNGDFKNGFGVEAWSDFDSRGDTPLLRSAAKDFKAEFERGDNGLMDSLEEHFLDTLEYEDAYAELCEV